MSLEDVPTSIEVKANEFLWQHRKESVEVKTMLIDFGRGLCADLQEQFRAELAIMKAELDAKDALIRALLVSLDKIERLNLDLGMCYSEAIQAECDAYQSLRKP